MRFGGFTRQAALGAFFIPVTILLSSCIGDSATQGDTGGGASVVGGGPAKGIDVSDNVGTVDWDEVKAAGYSFAFVKASDGVSYPQQYFQQNWPRMKASGIVRGAYHFYESGDDPVEQAKYFASVIDRAGGLDRDDLPPVLDFERATSGSNVLKFLNQIEQLTGRTPIIYVDESFANQYLTSPKFASYPLWIAEYGTDSPKVPATWSKAGRSWTFWQDSQSATVAGVSGGAGSTDTNVFNGDAAALARFIREN